MNVKLMGVAIMFAAFAVGCRSLMGGGAGNPQQLEAAKALKVCAATKTVKTATGNEHERPLTAPELTMFGNNFRDAGLDAQSGGYIGGGEGELSAAADCYGRALQLAPDNYAANFGLGVSYMGRAKNIASKTDRKRIALLSSAKRMLGRAYALRHGHLEALFYLAELAVHEDDFNRAKTYLEVLKKRGYKPGPVAALLGYMAEAQGNDAQAQIHYEAALMAGWPLETLVWVTRKVKK